MGYRLYILSIRDLADETVQQTALACLDSHRKSLVHKYKKHDDRLRAIAAGLLLQVGFLELGVAGDDVSSEMMRISVTEALQLLQEYALEHAISLPLPLSYEYGTHGKPAWQRRCIDQLKPDKAYGHFNLSHSGNYVVLAISDTPVGVDIQMERTCDYPGGYKAFSRMEAFVKCTGEGIANGRKEYKEISNAFNEYEVFEADMENPYVIQVCRVK